MLGESEIHTKNDTDEATIYVSPSAQKDTAIYIAVLEEGESWAQMAWLTRKQVKALRKALRKALEACGT